LETAGAEVIVPAVADYEVRRELVRVGATAKLRRLTLIRARLDYLPVSESAWEKAAEFWASVRNAGAPTAGPQDLDADAILAGQAATAGRRGDTIMIATTNARHLGRFPGIDARFWAAIA
jgi:predicted nucleic acid-binding protein